MQKRKDLLSEALIIMEAGLVKTKKDRWNAVVLTVILLMLLLYSRDIVLTYGLNFIFDSIRFIVTVVVAYLLWFTAVSTQWELKALTNVKNDLINEIKLEF